MIALVRKSFVAPILHTYQEAILACKGTEWWFWISVGRSNSILPSVPARCCCRCEGGIIVTDLLPIRKARSGRVYIAGWFKTLMAAAALTAWAGAAPAVSLTHEPAFNRLADTPADRPIFPIAFDRNRMLGTAWNERASRVLVGAPGDDTRGDGVGQAYLFRAGSGTLLQTFDDPTVTDHDQFGRSVALDNNRVLVGAPGDDTIERGAGQAYLFDAGTGKLLRTFNDPTVTDGDQFGRSVVLAGDRVLIGAPGDDTKSDNSGQAYLFDANSGTLLQIFNNPSETGREFGTSVALDGSRVLIGAPANRHDGQRAGQAYLFDASTGKLLRTFNDPTITDAGHERFGFSVALEGDRVLIGTQLDRGNGPAGGKAYLFNANTGALIQTFNDPVAKRTSPEGLGLSVALNNRRALIGAQFGDTNTPAVGQARLFDTNTGALIQTFSSPGEIRHDSGFAVALNANRALIGAPGNDTEGDGVGQAYLYEPETGALLQTFNDPTLTDNDQFGRAVDLDESGPGVVAVPGDRSDGDGNYRISSLDPGKKALRQILNGPDTTQTGYEPSGILQGLGGNPITPGSRYGDGEGRETSVASLGEGLPAFDDSTNRQDDDSGGSGINDGNSQKNVFDPGTGLPPPFDGSTDEQGDQWGGSGADDDNPTRGSAGEAYPSPANPVAVPEPASFILLLLGFVAIALLRHARRSRA